MKIKSLRMKNFRCFKDTEIKFNDRLTVIIGDNATGKTTVLEGAGIPLYLAIMDKSYYSPNDSVANDKIGKNATTISIDTNLGCQGVVLKRDSRFEYPFSFVKSVVPIAQESQISSTETTSTKTIIRFFYLKRMNAELNVNKKDEATITFDDIFGSAWTYGELMEWFSDRRFEESTKREKNNEYRDNLLEAIRDAVDLCLPEYKNFDVGFPPAGGKILVLARKDTGEKIDARLLSSGYLSILSIISDLALRMAKSNPHMDNPLESEAIVLIDEIDLSLHPKWQQRVLEDLPRVFPNAQFIVTTHSPLVLTTVNPENIVYLKRECDDIVVHYGTEMGIGTKGADAMRLMSYFMEVSSRPPEIKEQIRNYFLLIDAGKAESEEAKKERATLEGTLGSDDPVFASADAAITRKKRFA